jgi:hypothetical protein
MPMLTYGTESATTTLTDTALGKAMSFDATKEVGTSDTVELYVVKTALNGTFLGFERLSTQLQYCSSGVTGSVVGTPSWLRFGHGYTSEYVCDLKALLTSSAAKNPVFYDVYVRDLAADAAAIAAQGTQTSTSVKLPMTLYPVPVAIVNYRSSDGSTPNVNTNWGSEANDVYQRRFSLVDGTSGITTAGDNAEVLRYAVDIRISVRARRDDSATTGRPKYMSPPLITIKYRERMASSILSDGDAGHIHKSRVQCRHTGFQGGIHHR